jgi:hypothetical protein
VRQAALRFATRHSPFVGSPTTVANEFERWFREGAADGFNIGVGEPDELEKFSHEVVPILQARGLFRREYEADTLRGNLGLTIPANRYTALRNDEQPQRADLPSSRPTASEIRNTL